MVYNLYQFLMFPPCAARMEIKETGSWENGEEDENAGLARRMGSVAVRGSVRAFVRLPERGGAGDHGSAGACDTGRACAGA